MLILNIGEDVEEQYSYIEFRMWVFILVVIIIFEVQRDCGIFLQMYDKIVVCYLQLKRNIYKDMKGIKEFLFYY